LTPDPAAEAAQIASLKAWREARDGKAVAAALASLRAAAAEGRNIMAPSIAAAHAGCTTGEWAAALRHVFGEYRAPTGVGGAANDSPVELADLRREVGAVSRRLGRPLKLLVGKPGLDGHSNGAEQIAVRARDAGFAVVYQGIRSTPEEIVASALEEAVDVVGLSILSGSHVELVGEVLKRMVARGLGRIPVVVGGIVPPHDAERLRAAGVARVYTPKDYALNAIISDLVALVDGASQEPA
jgi:(2R)-ethylmalonyl-CoA mutase